MLNTLELFDLSRSLAGDYLADFLYPWEALDGIGALIQSLGKGLGTDYRQTAPDVWIHETAAVAPTAFLAGPCIIGPGSQVRHCAFIRGSALVGENCVVGNSVELKNAILFDRVQVPHFNYVGDSILGCKAHMGAGAVTSNVKSDGSPVTVRYAGAAIATGRRKLGAMLGDYVEVGCNSVLNPGTVVGRNSTVYPLSCVRGTIPPGSIHKSSGEIVQKHGF